MAEGARLESVYTFTGIGGSNPSLSAIQSGLQRNSAASFRKSCKIAAIPQLLLSNRTGESVPLSSSRKLSCAFLWRADTQSGFNVRFAAEPCKLSSASPSCNFSSDLRLILAGTPHESTSPASNLARASARTLVLCLAFVRMQYGRAIQTLRSAAPRPFSLRPATETQAL